MKREAPARCVCVSECDPGVRRRLKPLCARADNTMPMEQRRNYKGVGDAFVRIVAEDGVMGLFRGAGPTIVRAMSLNMGMFAANEQVRAAPPRPFADVQ